MTAASPARRARSKTPSRPSSSPRSTRACGPGRPPGRRRRGRDRSRSRRAGPRDPWHPPAWVMPGHPPASEDRGMSTLVAIAYPDRATADEVVGTLSRLQTEHLISIEDAVVVTRNAEGKVKLHQTKKLAASGAAGGALWGGLIGLIFFMPLLGMAIGAATGAATGALTDIGVDDQFMKDLGAKLQPDGAALIVLIRSSTPDRVLPEVASFGGEVIQTSLTSDAEEHLRAVLEARDAAAA